MRETHGALDGAVHTAGNWSSLRASFANVRSKQSISPITIHGNRWHICLAQAQGIWFCLELLFGKWLWKWINQYQLQAPHRCWSSSQLKPTPDGNSFAKLPTSLGLVFFQVPTLNPWGRKDRFHIVFIALNMQGILKFDYDITLHDVQVARMHDDNMVKHTCVVVSHCIIEGRDFFTFWIWPGSYFFKAGWWLGVQQK